MIPLHHEMTYCLRVTGPLEPKDGSVTDGRRQWWEMSEATLEGPRIRASTPSPGIDWFTPHVGGYGRPHVRLPFRTHDGAIVLLEYHGIVHATAAFSNAVERDLPTQWEDQYMRMALFFETTSERYQWLTQSLFLARGRLLGAMEIQYDVYRVG